MTRAVLDVRLLERGDWHVLRTIRLRALAESPHAFTSPYQREFRWSEHQWRRRVETEDWFVAVDDGHVIGMAALVDCSPHDPHHIESIWVAPTHRNRGVFRALLDGIIEIARRAGLTDLWLWVLEDNRCALRVYERLGFEWTGERQPIRPRHRCRELRLRRRI
ncbi:MAG: GNAT family N-acetyltransferase [Pseudonocardia sp.]|nr:GNAT family N-acetyltransferase [Pseudonocardia sp.]